MANTVVSENDYGIKSGQKKHYSDFISPVFLSMSSYTIGDSITENFLVEDFGLFGSGTSHKLFSEKILERMYSFSYRLFPLVSAVKEAINDLNSDYASENDIEAIDSLSLQHSIDFLISHAKYLLERFEKAIPIPFIDCLNDGSIYLRWETDNAKLLVVFKKDKPSFSFFYGEVKKTGIPFKSAIENNGQIDEVIALWIYRNLL